MRRFVWFVAALAGLMPLFPRAAAVAQTAESEVGDEWRKPPCTPAGTWYGGSEGPIKYVALITPLTTGRFQLTFQGAYDMTAVGFPVTTIVPGEFRKERHGDWQYVGTALGLVNTSAMFPPAVPAMLVVRFRLRLEGCDTLHVQHDFFGGYQWGSRPLVDPPDFFPAPTPIDETYERLPIECPACSEP